MRKVQVEKHSSLEDVVSDLSKTTHCQQAAVFKFQPQHTIETIIGASVCFVCMFTHLPRYFLTKFYNTSTGCERDPGCTFGLSTGQWQRGLHYWQYEQTWCRLPIWSVAAERWTMIATMLLDCKVWANVVVIILVSDWKLRLRPTCAGRPRSRPCFQFPEQGWSRQSHMVVMCHPLPVGDYTSYMVCTSTSLEMLSGYWILRKEER